MRAQQGHKFLYGNCKMHCYFVDRATLNWLYHYPVEEETQDIPAAETDSVLVLVLPYYIDVDILEFYIEPTTQRLFHRISDAKKQQKKQTIVQEIREKRTRLLQESDWTRLDDTSLTPAQKEAWAAYRQALRDLPQQVEEISDDVFFAPGQQQPIVWPTPP